jgi:ATP-binding protein involved in chromosome partitioning
MSVEDGILLLQPAATRVRDPLSGRSVWLAGIVQPAAIVDGALALRLRFKPEHAAADRVAIAEALIANLRGLGWAGPVVPEVSEEAPPRAPRRARDPIPGMSGPGVAPHGGPITRKPLEGVRKVIAVASGKGGVGKSTVAANLAVALRMDGWSVGLLDADIYGPSLPLMMNTTQRPMIDDEKKVIPPSAYGVKCLSMGLLVDANEAMIWRGPMVMGVVRQFLQDTRWGELDVLVVDLPPGTGDVQLTLVQAVSLDGAVIVSTPQEVALADAVRGIEMFRKLEVPLLGVVQNMAYYQLPDGTRDHVFGEGGAARVAAQQGCDVLVELPLQTSIRRGADAGLPAVLGSDAVAATFRELGRKVAERLGLGA